MQQILPALLVAGGLAVAALNHSSLAQTVQPAQQKSAEDDIWDIIKDTTNAGLLQGFLEGYPNSRHAAAARARLATLTAPKAGPANPAARATTPKTAAPKPAAPATGTATAPTAIAPIPAAPATKRTSTTTVSRPAASPAAAAEPKPAAPSTSTTAAIRPFQLFQEPRGDDNPNNPRVDWCLNWATSCGRPAADAFCKSRGFQRAASFETRQTGGPTWVAGARTIWRRPECTALAAVMCEGHDETQLIKHQTK
jgi:hypothetical protein